MPLRIDGALPDFLVPAETFDKGLKRVWNEGDRFRMFFAARTTSKAGTCAFVTTQHALVMLQLCWAHALLRGLHGLRPHLC